MNTLLFFTAIIATTMLAQSNSDQSFFDIRLPFTDTYIKCDGR